MSSKLHAWGDSLKEAFEQVGMAMFNYMTTDYDTVEILDTVTTEASGDDALSLLFHFLDEWLFVFSAEPFFIPRVSSSFSFLSYYVYLFTLWRFCLFCTRLVTGCCNHFVFTISWLISRCRSFLKFSSLQNRSHR
ncbi:Protein archease [Fasciolopsis buskii]|uniref:Protein archease n=1 Tax=Fasciolopsis buskii TaxID=27845 RepID=A0A8E0RT99_9TREM|nr:Protein archease [Fasciolopsis buski]